MIHEALLLQRDRTTHLAVEILQLRIIPFKKDCKKLQSINDFEVYTLKVIAIDAFR